MILLSLLLRLDGARCSVGWSASRVYGTLRSTGLLAGYIIPCYDVLHTFSKEYMVEHPDVQHSRPNLDFGRGKPAVVNGEMLERHLHFIKAEEI